MDTKFKCLLLDDELPGLTYLRTLCEQIPEIEVVKAFNDPLVFMKEVNSLDFDFCILDIEMPGLNGLEVAGQLNNKPVIFTTAYKEYASDAFDLNAVDYIRKPIQKERLEKAINKLIQVLRQTGTVKQFIQLNTSRGRALIYFYQLIYITTAEIDKRDKYAYLINGEKLTIKNVSFDALINLLPPEQFFRINKKQIVSLKAVRFFIHDEITLSLSGNEEKRFYLGQNYREDFFKIATR